MKLYEFNMVYQHKGHVNGAIFFENIELNVIASAEYTAQLFNDHILSDKSNMLLSLHITPTGENVDPDDVPKRGVFD